MSQATETVDTCRVLTGDPKIEAAWPKLLPGAVLLSGALLLADANGLLRLGWSWAGALVCVSAGAALIAQAPPAPTMYVGALARLTIRPMTLWPLRAAVVATAPLAGAGPAAYALLALAQALFDPVPDEFHPDWRRSVGTALIGLGLMLSAVELGLSAGGEKVIWTVALVSTGLSAFWWSSRLSTAVRRSLAAAAAVVLFFYVTVSAFSAPDGRVLAGVAGALIIALVVAPRWSRNSRALANERARSARSEERAEVAELVHDSVLQTLALIQSRADDPGEVRALARQQERDLRARLFKQTDPAAQPTTIATALRTVAAEVEDAHRVKIDAVTVGDTSLDERGAALVAAAREALFNAAKHAPGTPVSLFAEVNDRRVAVFVRDRGPGFDLEAIPADRRGVTDSIIGRMARHGGQATVRTAPGGGCEVRLLLERPR